MPSWLSAGNAAGETALGDIVPVLAVGYNGDQLSGQRWVRLADVVRPKGDPVTGGAVGALAGHGWGDLSR